MKGHELRAPPHGPAPLHVAVTDAIEASAAVGEAAALLGGAPDVPRTLRAIAESARKVLGAARATCYTCGTDRQVVTAVYTTESDPARRAFLEDAVGRGPMELPIWRLQLAQLDPLLAVEDVSRDPRVPPGLARRLGAGAFLGVRLEHHSVCEDGRPALLGTLACSYPEPRSFSAGEQTAASGLATLAVLALANARLHATATDALARAVEAAGTIRRQAEENAALAAEQAALLRVATEVAGGGPPDAVFSVVAEELAGLLGADAAGVTRRAGAMGEVVGSWTRDRGPGAGRGTLIPLDGSSASARALALGQPVRRDSPATLDPASARAFASSPFACAVAAPVFVGPDLWGVVSAASDTAGALPPDAARRLGRFATLVGVAVANAEVRTQLAAQAATDPLTGLANRRTIDARLERAAADCERAGRPLSVVVLDLDGFKQINDAYGHDAGDAALRLVARTLEASLRPDDLVGRLGGEEFLVMLPGTGTRAAWLVAERLRAAIAGLAIDEGPALSASVGVASLPDHVGGVADLVRAADSAMYHAKSLGRNRSVVFSPERAAVRTEQAGRAQRGHESFLGSVLALAAAVDARDPSTHEHSEVVARYAAAIAARLGLTGDRIEELRIAGLLHDIGKVGVPDAVLQKQGRLTAAEWQEMRRHPEIGARILTHPALAEVREWVLRHHERPDGRGYPGGLSGERIPLEARILAVADAYEAMTGDRPYRQALTAPAARAQLAAGRGTQFDARVVDVFLAWLGEAPARAEVTRAG